MQNSERLQPATGPGLQAPRAHGVRRAAASVALARQHQPCICFHLRAASARASRLIMLGALNIDDRRSACTLGQRRKKRRHCNDIYQQADHRLHTEQATRVTLTRPSLAAFFRLRRRREFSPPLRMYRHHSIIHVFLYRLMPFILRREYSIIRKLISLDIAPISDVAPMPLARSHAAIRAASK